MEEGEREEREERLAPSPEVILKLLDVDEYIQRIDAYLSGEVIKMTESGIIREKIEGARPLLNQKGRAELLQIMRARLDPVIYSTSILDMDFIRDEVYFFNINLISLFLKKAEEWELDITKFSEIIDFLVSSYEAQLRKALGGQFLRWILGVAGVVEKEQKKRRFWFLPW